MMSIATSAMNTMTMDATKKNAKTPFNTTRNPRQARRCNARRFASADLAITAARVLFGKTYTTDASGPSLASRPSLCSIQPPARCAHSTMAARSSSAVPA